MHIPKILIVEDENIIAMDLQCILESLGFRDTMVVPSGEASIEAVSTMLPDLVLMDIKLRGKLDGISAAKKIYNQFRIPVIYLTAYGDEKTRDRINRSGSFGHINKPFAESELEAAIKRTLQNFQKFSSLN